MNPKKDIKVTFLARANSGNAEKIRVFFKDIFNNDVQIDLRPDETVYSQTDHLSNSLKIYSKKGLIKISEEEKPEYLKYYTGYKQEEIDNRNYIHSLQASLKHKDNPKPEVNDVGDIVASVKNTLKVSLKANPSEDVTTIVDKAIKEVKKYSESKKKKSKSRKGPGRPKKRGPKKGSKKKKAEE